MRQLTIAAACLAGFCLTTAASAQTLARPRMLGPAQKAETPPPAAKAEEPAACARFDHARNIAYAAYIKQIVEELPDPRKAQNREEMGQDLEKLYNEKVELAKAGDREAFRKAAALELFGMQLQKKPVADTTRRKLCALARQPERQSAMLDTIACLVATLDSDRREQAETKATARQLAEKAKALVPAKAGPTDPSKMLYDDVTRGLEGCY